MLLCGLLCPGCKRLIRTWPLSKQLMFREHCAVNTVCLKPLNTKGSCINDRHCCMHASIWLSAQQPRADPGLAQLWTLQLPTRAHVSCPSIITSGLDADYASPSCGASCGLQAVSSSNSEDSPASIQLTESTGSTVKSDGSSNMLAGPKQDLAAACSAA